MTYTATLKKFKLLLKHRDWRQLKTLLVYTPPLSNRNSIRLAGVLNYRRFDYRLLWARYALLPYSRNNIFEILVNITTRVSFFLFIFGMAICLILFFVEGARESSFYLGFLNLITQTFFSFAFDMAWTTLAASLWDLLYVKLSDYVYFVSFGWELFLESGAEKFSGRTQFFSLLYDCLGYWSGLVFIIIVLLILIQSFFLISFILFISKIHDHWSILLALFQNADWDNTFLRAETVNQALDINLTDAGVASTKFLTNFLYFYKLGFIDNEFKYYNTLDRLISSSRSTFFGYRGFLNLFPSTSTIFDNERFFKKHLLRKPKLSNRSGRLSVRGLRSKFFTLLKLNSSARVFTFFFAPFSVFSVGRNFFIKSSEIELPFGGWYSSIIKFFSFSDSAVSTESSLVRKTTSMFSYNTWYLRFSDDADGVLKDPVVSLTAEDGPFSWYFREISLFSAFYSLPYDSTKKRFFGFNYGFHRFLGDFAFLKKESNYHAMFEHDYPDVEAPFFESADSFKDEKTSIFDKISGADEEEFEGEDDIEYSDYLLFEDAFLHADTESVSFRDENFESLMLDQGLLRSDKLALNNSQEFDTEDDEAREDIFDTFLTHFTASSEYRQLTTSEDYAADAGIEFGDSLTYSERIFDSVYDDLVDFFWVSRHFVGVTSPVQGITPRRSTPLFFSQRRARRLFFFNRMYLGRLYTALPSFFFKNFFNKLNFFKSALAYLFGFLVFGFYLSYFLILYIFGLSFYLNFELLASVSCMLLFSVLFGLIFIACFRLLNFNFLLHSVVGLARMFPVKLTTWSSTKQLAARFSGYLNYPHTPSNFSRLAIHISLLELAFFNLQLRQREALYLVGYTQTRSVFLHPSKNFGRVDKSDELLSFLFFSSSLSSLRKLSLTSPTNFIAQVYASLSYKVTGGELVTGEFFSLSSKNFRLEQELFLQKQFWFKPASVTTPNWSKNVFSRFFFSQLKVQSIREFTSLGTGVVVKDFWKTSPKLTLFTDERVVGRRESKGGQVFLEPHLGTTELALSSATLWVAELFATSNLLDRIYFEQVSKPSNSKVLSENFFYISRSSRAKVGGDAAGKVGIY